jgi:hypothetical protein
MDKKFIGLVSKVLKDTKSGPLLSPSNTAALVVPPTLIASFCSALQLEQYTKVPLFHFFLQLHEA